MTLSIDVQNADNTIVVSLAANADATTLGPLPDAPRQQRAREADLIYEALSPADDRHDGDPPVTP